MRKRKRPVSIAAVLAPLLGVLLRAGVACADDGAKPALPSWDPAYSHAGVWDYSLSAVGLSALLAETAILQNRSPDPRWTGPILFDQAVRDATRGSTEKLRADAATVSWVLWFVEMGYPLAVDVPYAWARYGREVAWDLFWQDATAMSLSAAVDFGMRDVVGRVRPGPYECLTTGGRDCLDGPETRRSFPSGHFTETSTATALICTQHLKLELYGAPWDALTCASAITADATVGTLRLIADNHWATDVLAGGAVGFLFGWGVPTLMHLHGHSPPPGRAGGSTWMIAPAPIMVIQGAGIGAIGIF